MVAGAAGRSCPGSPVVLGDFASKLKDEAKPKLHEGYPELLNINDLVKLCMCICYITLLVCFIYSFIA